MLRHRDALLAAALFLLALFIHFMPEAYQGRVRQALLDTALRPFASVQLGLVAWHAHAQDLGEVMAERDSLAAILSDLATLAEENQALRAVLELRERAAPDFVAAEVVRLLGVTGAAGTFWIDVGAEHGVQVNSPVLTADGLLGVVREVGRRHSLAAYWAHPDFRASAMTADGTAFGIVEARRADQPEEDILILRGAPFHADVRPGTAVLTAGAGGIYRRGIPLGTVVRIETADPGWQKSYLVKPAVRPEAVTHVLVEVRRDSGTDLMQLWAPESVESGSPPGEQRAATRRP